jgi:hypothetical protein
VAKEDVGTVIESTTTKDEEITSKEEARVEDR